MPCVKSCMISLVFLIGMIYFYYMTDKSEIVNRYKSSLSNDSLQRYNKISKERLRISCEGYSLSLILSLGIIYQNIINNRIMNPPSLVCIVLATAFITNYFYYMLSSKSDWMLNHTTNQEEVKIWLKMYREMQFNYHKGLVLGMISVSILAYAFRC